MPLFGGMQSSLWSDPSSVVVSAEVRRQRVSLLPGS